MKASKVTCFQPTLQRLFVSLVVWTLASSGCLAYDHVVLDPPPLPDAPFAERRDAYQMLRPATPRVSADGDWALGVTLGDSRFIEAPDDLLPVVRPNSATARFASAAVTSRDVANGLRIGTVTLGVAGVALLAQYNPAREERLSAGFWTGAGMLLSASITELIRWFYVRDERKEASNAFDSYDRDLQQRLSLDVSK